MSPRQHQQVESAASELTPEDVLERCGSWIYRSARRLRERMPWAEIDDMVQEGIVAALEMRDRYCADRGIPFEVFIKPRVIGAMIDMLRRTGRMMKRDLRAAVEWDTFAASNAIEQIIKSDDLKALEVEIERLPNDERLAISLFYLEELSNKEIALVMGITETKATRLRQRAINILASSLAQRSEETKAKSFQEVNH